MHQPMAIAGLIILVPPYLEQLVLAVSDEPVVSPDGDVDLDLLLVQVFDLFFVVQYLTHQVILTVIHLASPSLDVHGSGH